MSASRCNHATELFKEKVAGTDLKLAVLKLMNLIKQRQQYPETMDSCNITSIKNTRDRIRTLTNIR